jgi:Tyrosine-protein kinase ephrin type A/B receptor-like
VKYYVRFPTFYTEQCCDPLLFGPTGTPESSWTRCAGQSCASTVIASSTGVSFHFQSDYSIHYSGFVVQVTKASADQTLLPTLAPTGFPTPTNAGPQTFNVSSGNITHLNYNDNENIRWNYKIAGVTSYLIRFPTFYTELNYDPLTFGPTGSAELGWTRCWGTSCASAVIASTTGVSFHFVSDYSVHYTGFVIQVTPSSGGQSAAPTLAPVRNPSVTPTATPTAVSTVVPTATPTAVPTATPTWSPTTATPTQRPTTPIPTAAPTVRSGPSFAPTRSPTAPTSQPTRQPSRQPTTQPTRQPSGQPSSQPMGRPTAQPTSQPTHSPKSAGTYLCQGGVCICPAGTYSMSGSTVCTGCPAGTYSLAGASICTPCAMGSDSKPFSSVCTLCPAGTYGPLCTMCPVGTYAPLPGSAVCTACPTSAPKTIAGAHSVSLCFA